MKRGSKKQTAQFSAAIAEKIDLKGAAHKAVIGPDGWAIFRDVPIFGPVPKGEKGAPENIGRKYMEKMVSFSMADYQTGSYAAPIHKGHHKSLAIEDPEFLGFFLAKRVGKATIEGKEEDAVLADIKFKPSAFQSAQRGELPYLSPEVDWATGQFMSLSFLDSNPPHFKFPTFTVGEVVMDASAKFEAALKPTTFERACCQHCMSYQQTHGKTFEDKGMETAKPDDKDKVNKPSVTPVEPNQPTTMSATPASVKFEIPTEFAAKFAAAQDKIVELTKRLDEKDAEKASKGLEEKALEDLKGYRIGDATRAQIAEFSKLGKDRLDKLVASIKELAPKEPPRSMAEFMGQAVSASDPVLAKFAANPAELEVASRALSEHRYMEKNVKGYSVPAEKHIEFAIRAAKARAASEGGN